jgi:hypothetical protein
MITKIIKTGEASLSSRVKAAVKELYEFDFKVPAATRESRTGTLITADKTELIRAFNLIALLTLEDPDFSEYHDTVLEMEAKFR